MKASSLPSNLPLTPQSSFLEKAWTMDYPVEEFFGKQRQLGRRSDNLGINQFGYNSNAITI